MLKSVLYNNCEALLNFVTFSQSDCQLRDSRVSSTSSLTNGNSSYAFTSIKLFKLKAKVISFRKFSILFEKTFRRI